MIILEAYNINFSIQDRTFFQIEQLTMEANDRIGLVGANGSGKTTLLQMLLEQKAEPDGTINAFVPIGYVPQLKTTDSSLSGGEITEKYIQEVLVQKPGLLLLDEPTTNLDTAHIEKLENQLKRFTGACIIVSHDRAFLDATCTTIWEIANETLQTYKGNYTDYYEQKQLQRQQMETAYEQYTQKRKQLETALELKEEKAKRATKKPKSLSSSEARIKGAKPYYANKQKKLRQTAKAMETRLEKLEQPDKPEDPPALQMDVLHGETLQGKNVLQLDNVTAHVPGRHLWQSRHIDVKSGDKIAIIGPNGSGKTTLVKKIIEQAPGITITPSAVIGYFSQNLDQLDTEKSILDNVMSTSNQSETMVRIILARLRFFRDDVYKPVHVLSGGERVKIAFAKVFVSRINVLLLDEPTNYLDVDAVEALEELLLAYPGTLLFVSHDRRLVQRVATRIFHIDAQQLHVFEGDYDAFQQQDSRSTTSEQEEELMRLQTKLTEVIGKLSMTPSEELEETYDNLLTQIHTLKKS